MLILNFLNSIIYFIYLFRFYNVLSRSFFLLNFSFFSFFLFFVFYRLLKISFLLWNDALLIDFLQKKFLSKWTFNFLISSSYLFNERFLFENLIFSLFKIVLSSTHRLFFFDFNNFSSIFFLIFYIFLFLLFFILFSLFWTIFF